MLKTTKGGQHVRWSSSVVTMHVDPKLETLLGRAEVRAALNMASDAWRGLPGVPSIVLSNQPASGYSDQQRSNGIYLMDPWPFPKEQLAVTVSTYASNGRMLGADVLVNADTRYALLADGSDDASMKQHDLGAVLTHEFGHVLGLDESPDDESATMWPYIRSGDVHQRTLSEDDEQGVIAAYVGAAPSAAVGCGQASVMGARRMHAPAACCLPLLLVAAAAWRSRARRQPR